ncbi:MAG: hypothetical protein JSV53_05470 [candidate division WOR-3 bacterium]|nr:MAG: hypothetical protein JSV53_05470 [candidate division WOR-3 bacterium]
MLKTLCLSPDAPCPMLCAHFAIAVIIVVISVINAVRQSLRIRRSIACPERVEGKQSQLDPGVGEMNGNNEISENDVSRPKTTSIRSTLHCHCEPVLWVKQSPSVNDSSDINGINDNNGLLSSKSAKVYACPQTDNGKLGNSEPWKINGINDNSDNNELNESTAGKEIS